MAERAATAEHPTYRELLALWRDLPVPAGVREHVQHCPICRDVQAALADEAAPDDLAAAWLAERPVTLSDAAIAAVLGGASAPRPAAPPVTPAAPVRRTAPPPGHRRPWRWAVAPTVVAAAAMLLVLTRTPALPGVDADARPAATSVGAGSPAAGTAAGTQAGASGGARVADGSTAGAGVRPAPTRPSATARGATRGTVPVGAPSATRGGPALPHDRTGHVGGVPRAPAAMPSASVREIRGGLHLVLVAGVADLDATQRSALDSAAALLARDPQRHAMVRYTDPALDGASPSGRLAQRAQDHLLVAGVAPDRVRLSRVQTLDAAGVPSGVEAVEIVVGAAPPGPPRER